MLEVLKAKEDDWEGDWGEAFKYAGHMTARGDKAKPPGLVLGDDVPTTPFDREDVEHIEALHEGENEESPWYIWGRLKDGRWFYLEAWCDYTGWD